jgi:peptide/nickel transport system substrate-binding protein
MGKADGRIRGALGYNLNRRRVLKGASIAGAGLALTAAGCGVRAPAGGASSGASGASGAAQPKKGGVLVHAGGGTVGSYDVNETQIDPHINTPLGARGYRLMYQGLLGYDPHTYEVQPELAAKWEQASPTEIVFHLQPNVKWQNKAPVNGRPLVADDVVFSLNRVRSNDPRFTQRSLLDNIDTVTAVDQSTVKVTTKSPDATILSYLSSDPPLVLAPEVVQKYDNKFTDADSVVGTGPFIMKTLQPQVSAEYVRNPDYWKTGRPYLDGLRTRKFDDQNTAYAAFQANQIDFMLLPGQNTKEYIDKQGPGFKPDWFKDDTVFPMFQPNTKMKLFSDARVTQALRLLIDHDEFKSAWVLTWFGGGRDGSCLCPALDTWDFSEAEYAQMLEWKKPKDDAAKQAIALLTAAGFSKDNPVSFEITGGNDGFIPPALQLAQAQWARLSGNMVKTTIKQVDQAAQNSVRANRTFEVFIGGNSAAFPDPDAWFSVMYATGASRNYAGFSDPTFDAMIPKQRTIFDTQQRKATVKNMVKYLIDNAPTSMFVNRYFLNGVKPKVHGWAAEFYMNGRQYENVWMDS